MTRTRLTFVVVVLVAALVAGAHPASGSAAVLRTRMLGFVNRSRDAHGLRALKLDLDLSNYALYHSRRMAAAGYLFHSTHTARHLRGTNWSAWGENLGAARTLRRVKNLWLKSPDHRYNLLNRHYHRVGIGVVRSGGLCWVTAIFYG